MYYTAGTTAAEKAEVRQAGREDMEAVEKDDQCKRKSDVLTCRDRACICIYLSECKSRYLCVCMFHVGTKQIMLLLLHEHTEKTAWTNVYSSSRRNFRYMRTLTEAENEMKDAPPDARETEPLEEQQGQTIVQGQQYQQSETQSKHLDTHNVPVREYVQYTRAKSKLRDR